MSGANRPRHPEAGFTVLELLTVIGLIGIVLGLYVGRAQSSMETTRQVACLKNRTLAAETESHFQTRYGRPSHDLLELVDNGLVNKIRCPSGGVVAWAVLDPTLPDARRSLVCSYHGSMLPAEDRDAPCDFKDDFGGASSAHWLEVSGNYWQTREGCYRAGRTGGLTGEHRAFAGNAAWSDYVVSARVRIVSGPGFGFFFRVTEPRSAEGYFVRFITGRDRARVILRRVEDGVPTDRVAAADVNEMAGTKTRIYRVRILVGGDDIQIEVDGRLVLQTRDTKLTRGGIGLFVPAGGVVEFDDVRAKALGGR